MRIWLHVARAGALRLLEGQLRLILVYCLCIEDGGWTFMESGKIKSETRNGHCLMISVWLA